MADYEYSFQDQMAQGKAIAEQRRYRELPTGKPAAGWINKRPDPIGLDRIQFEYDTWRKEWQYQAVAAVEWALFGDDWQDLCEF